MACICPPGVDCNHRRRVAAEIQNATDEGSLPCKIYKCFPDDIDRSVSTGTIGDSAFMMLLRVACTIAADTQEVEGMNGMLKALMKHAPAIDIPLLSARLVNRMSLAILPSTPRDVA
eukprot:4794708-Pyramimonas_sp.AAC.1